jgi:hypothetical protein
MDSLSIEEGDTKPGFRRQGQSRNCVTAARLDFPRHDKRFGLREKPWKASEQGKSRKTPGM